MKKHANQFTHLDKNDHPTIVDIESKPVSVRTATAQSKISLPPEVLVHFSNGEIVSKKGAVFQSAIIAGIMAAKKTADLIPLCHTLSLENCAIDIAIENNDAVITCTVKTTGKTGVEMEALTGASVAALTIYDMCKAFSHNMIIKETKLLSKHGGKNDYEQ